MNTVLAGCGHSPAVARAVDSPLRRPACTCACQPAAQLDARQFQQVHRSIIVNLAQLAGTRRDEASRLFLRVKGHAHEQPVSRAYVHLFKAM